MRNDSSALRALSCSDYFGLSGLLSDCGDFKNSISSHLHTDDFNSNGVDVRVITNPAMMSDLNNNVMSDLPLSTASIAYSGFLPLNFSKVSTLASWSCEKICFIITLNWQVRPRKWRGGAMGTATRPPSWCVFCKNNGESEMVYASHKLKSEDGITSFESEHTTSINHVRSIPR
ncbi:uncharacterized protein LOC121425246 [Lytechinus variegatus]|uniref:uncharacterized protein LOC121425246 n=1 Tax=Lytechinus variegatus TaxID=7654 RepID=UPI001BB2C821|nr:uncharacterized protein LOC121425246 [Lytechinus variegatus]